MARLEGVPEAAGEAMHDGEGQACDLAGVAEETPDARYAGGVYGELCQVASRPYHVR